MGSGPRNPVADPGSTTSSGDTPRSGQLDEILLVDDVEASMWAALSDGRLGDLVPEFPLLELEQDPVHRHKDVLAHTIAVTSKTSPRAVIRPAAMFPDIAKPQTRSFEHGTVTFRNHEQVGSKITRTRLRALGYPDDVVADVSRLVYLSGRFKGYSQEWTDSAVRRYARDAGPLLGDLNELVRCDCTTRNPRRFASLQRNVDHLEARIVELAREDRERAERPDLDGQAVMEHLGIAPGREVGQALAHLLELRRQRGGALAHDEALAALDAWAAAQGISPAG